MLHAFGFYLVENLGTTSRLRSSTLLNFLVSTSSSPFKPLNARNTQPHVFRQTPRFLKKESHLRFPGPIFETGMRFCNVIIPFDH